MSEDKHAPQILLRLVTLAAIAGSILLLLTKRDSGTAIVYDIFVYALSISALTLTTLQSIAIARQIRITRRSSGKITEAVNRLEELEVAEKKLTQAVMHDDVMERLIAKALHEAGVGDNDTERKRVAKIVQQELKR